MPELHFKGKEFVYNHHLSVPYCPIEPDGKKSLGEIDLSGNLVIHGDNLVALKALLPYYAGKVDCIFIDPPYNTGNENWSYSDAVNSPVMREWLNSNPVNKEDMLRHDKWLCMMYPRLKLLRELLADHGSLWMTLDDNESHRARVMLDEIFGEQNFVVEVEWEKRYTRSNNTDNFTSVIDHVIAYRKSENFVPNLTARDEQADARYTNPDNDSRGPWKPIPFLNPATCELRPNLCYTIQNPNTGQKTTPAKKDKAWRNEKAIYERFLKEKRFWWGADGKRPIPDIKRFLSEVKQGMAPITLWTHEFAGNTDDASRELTAIFGEKAFDTPKPTQLIERILEHATGPGAIVLDSFAGSGTTAHAVLSLNRKDGGNRTFVLVESEDYADKLTAERVRRVIKGYRFEGVQTEELHREKLTITSLKNAQKVLAHVASIENLEGHRFDVISKEVLDGELVITGEKRVTGKAEGLGGSFTYCKLGEPIDMDKLLTGGRMPKYEAIGAWLFHTATGEALVHKAVDQSKWFLGESAGYFVWLIYKPELEFLKSRESALTLDLAERIAKTKGTKGSNKRHLVFAPAKYVPNKMLLPLGVEHAPLPFALYRVEKS